MKDNNKSFLLSISIVTAGALIAMAIYFGIQNDNMPQIKGEKTTANQENANQPTQKAEDKKTTTPSTQNNPPQTTTTLDDDAIMGNQNTATVAIVEFSDYDCPYCKRHSTSIHNQIKENFVDTGKALYVFRDLPLSSHPHAQKKAEAAECATKQGGDEKYFQFHDKLFAGSISNDAGLVSLAQELNLDIDEFKNCLESEEMTDEVRNDINDASQAGIRSTPGFVIGKLDSNKNVTGSIISDAQSYEAFETVINKYLN